ncbi:MAG: GntR family transcriptional regulator [Ferrimicrobium sp.]
MNTSKNGITLTDQVAATLREQILAGKRRPGTLYSVYRIAEELNVSRTPVREAVLRLAEAGMIRFERNRGFRVLRTSIHELQEVFQLRILLEVPAAYRAAQVADKALMEGISNYLTQMRQAAVKHDEFLFMNHDRSLHELVLGASQNKQLVTLVHNLRLTTMTLGASTVDRSRTLEDIANEHQPLVDAIIQNDSPGAGSAMYHHVVHTGQLLLDQLIKEGCDPSDLDPGWAESFTSSFWGTASHNHWTATEAYHGSKPPSKVSKAEFTQ